MPLSFLRYRNTRVNFDIKQSNVEVECCIPRDEDHVDAALAQWRRERPDLNLSAKAVVHRLGRAARYVERATQHVFVEFGLHPYEYYVLGVLRRSGAPYRMSPTDLARTLLVTPASVTHRVDRLERGGLVRRTADPADRRGIRVELTARGLRVVERAVEAHVAAEEQAVSALDAEERERLSGLLRKLLLANDDTPLVPRP